MRVRVLFALVAVALSACVSEAGWRSRSRVTVTATCSGPSCAVSATTVSRPAYLPEPTAIATVTVSVAADAGDALAEVNAKRAARGLRPFVHDPALTQAAQACAAFRAERLLFGHCANDFAFLPPGASASAAGCAAYPASYGWMSCCVYDGYTYGGAAFVVGRDGKRYMHLFCR